MASFPRSLLNLEEYENHADNVLPKSIKEYYNLGACEMETLAENRRIFSRLLLLPKVLVNVSNINLATTVLGMNVSCPIGVAPAALQAMAHDSGELSVAKACSRLQILMGLSSQASKSIEEVASASPFQKLFFQLYVYKDRSVTLGLINRAEKSGFKAVAVTIDRPVLGRRESEIRNKFSLPPHLSLANFSTTNFGDTKADKSNLRAVRAQVEDQIDWSFLSWLREHTTMKIVVKGILTAEAAMLAVQHGADAVWISNHGGRQLDCVPTAVEVLPEIRQAIKDAGKPGVQLFVDGGFRRGTDVLKVYAYIMRLCIFASLFTIGVHYVGFGIGCGYGIHRSPRDLGPELRRRGRGVPSAHAPKR